MGECFVVRRPLVPLPTIYRENTRVENKLISVVNALLRGVGRGAGVSVRNCVIDLPPENLDRVGRGICLAEVLVVCDPVGFGDDDVGLVQVGEQIHRARSAIPSVWPVFDPQ